MGGRTALLINATQEFGLSIVRKLAQHGHNIVLSGASNPMGDDGMRRQGEVVYFPADLQNESDRYALVERIRDRFQSIDSVVINRVGQRHYRASVEEFPIEHWRDAIDHHLTSTFGLVKTIWPQMKSQHFGRIIQIVRESRRCASSDIHVYYSRLMSTMWWRANTNPHAWLYIMQRLD